MSATVVFITRHRVKEGRLDELVDSFDEGSRCSSGSGRRHRVEVTVAPRPARGWIRLNG